jgi:predicted PolB exonuclease-like 3'-5' exonuclease
VDTPAWVIVWDLETVPDAAAFARMQGTPDIEPAEAEEQMGDRFQKLPLHSIVCIGALIAERAPASAGVNSGGWAVRSLGAPHVGERPEGEIIQAFVERIGELRAQLVSFNGHGFDLPVLRYRAMLHGIHAPGLGRRPYFNRYSDDALDLCDALASFDARSRLSLDGLARFLGLAGKPEGVDGGKVAGLVKEGRIQEVADYCESDVVNTYRIWLRYELFRGGLSPDEHCKSEESLGVLLKARVAAHPRLAGVFGV